jgi:hypothetical protein
MVINDELQSSALAELAAIFDILYQNLRNLPVANGLTLPDKMRLLRLVVKLSLCVRIPFASVEN